MVSVQLTYGQRIAALSQKKLEHNQAKISQAGTARTDWWARRISSSYSDLVKRSPTPAGFNVIPGLFLYGDVDGLGRDLGATPNGRHAGAGITHSADPDPSLYPDLVVRVTGDSAYFHSLSPEYRQQIVDRFLG